MFKSNVKRPFKSGESTKWALDIPLYNTVHKIAVGTVFFLSLSYLDCDTHSSIRRIL